MTDSEPLSHHNNSDHDGDPRVSEESKAAVRALTQADWDQHADVVDVLTKHDFDDVDADI